MILLFTLLSLGSFVMGMFAHGDTALLWSVQGFVLLLLANVEERSR